MRFCARCRRVWREDVDFCPADGQRTAAIRPGADVLAGVELDGRYRLRSLLGAGGMGFVYLAEPVGGGGEVAIKMLWAERVRDASIVRRFAREARALGALDHPGCVRVLDVGDAEGIGPYIVMEVSNGWTLDAILHELGRLAPRHAADVAAQLAAALAAAHARSIVHRDLKPSNVILEVRDGAVVARILDFGFALLGAGADERSTAARLSRMDMVFGTPEYMAPEQASTTDADARTDLYALGVILYEMLTGGLPFTGPSPAAVIASKSAAAPPPLGPMCIGSDVARRLEQTVQALLATRPDDRPQDAGDVAAILRSLEADLPDPGPDTPLLARLAVGPRHRGAHGPNAAELGHQTTRDLEPPPETAQLLDLEFSAAFDAALPAKPDSTKP